MANLQRRLKKLEALPTDTAGLAAGSPRWWAYWTERVHKIHGWKWWCKRLQIPARSRPRRHSIRWAGLNRR